MICLEGHHHVKNRVQLIQAENDSACICVQCSEIPFYKPLISYKLGRIFIHGRHAIFFQFDAVVTVDVLHYLIVFFLLNNDSSID